MATKKQIADLHAQLTADVRKYITDMQAAAKETRATERGITDSMRKASSATKTFNDAQTTNIATSRNFRTGIQMAGYQMQDFAVQVAGGQSALVAFSQQGSQMLGIFGPTGAIAGAVLAVGVLAARMAGVGAQATKAKEQVNELTVAINAMVEAKRAAWADTASTAEKIFDADVRQSDNDEARLKATAEIARIEQAMVDRRIAGEAKIERLRRQSEYATPDAVGAIGLQIVSEANKTKSDIAKLDEELKQARKSYAELETSATNITRESTKLNTEASKERIESLDQLMAKQREQFDALVSGQKKANDEYEQGAKQSAALAAQEEARIQRLVEGYRQLADPFLKFREQIAEIQELQAKGRLTSEEAAGAIAKITNEIKRLEDALMDPEERAFLQNIEDQIKRNQESILRQTKHFTDAMNGMFQDVSNRAGDAFADMLMTGENAFDGLVDVVVRSVIRIATQMAIINPILNTLFGGFGGFVPLPSFWGGAAGTAAAAPVAGARAEGGPVDGGRSYLVGERGPELFTPGSSGSITSNGRLRAMSTTGGGNTYIINAPGATEQTVQRIQQALIQLAGPGVVERRAMTAMADSRRRGGLALA